MHTHAHTHTHTHTRTHAHTHTQPNCLLHLLLRRLTHLRGSNRASNFLRSSSSRLWRLTRLASWSMVVGCCASCWALQKQSKASVWMFEQPQKYHSSICWHVVVLNRTRTRNSSSGSSSSSDYKVKTKLGALKC